jgi:hypothetical protein
VPTLCVYFAAFFRPTASIGHSPVRREEQRAATSPAATSRRRPPAGSRLPTRRGFWRRARLS